MPKSTKLIYWKFFENQRQPTRIFSCSNTHYYFEMDLAGCYTMILWPKKNTQHVIDSCSASTKTTSTFLRHLRTLQTSLIIRIHFTAKTFIKMPNNPNLKIGLPFSLQVNGKINTKRFFADQIFQVLLIVARKYILVAMGAKNRFYQIYSIFRIFLRWWILILYNVFTFQRRAERLINDNEQVYGIPFRLNSMTNGNKSRKLLQH